MHSLISAALDAICVERDDQQYSESFDTAAAIVAEFGEPDLANILFCEIPADPALDEFLDKKMARIFAPFCF